jgi:hypothetical protein
MQQAEESAKNYASLISLSKDFLFSAMAYGKIIISEFYLNDKEKTIKPVSVGMYFRSIGDESTDRHCGGCQQVEWLVGSSTFVVASCSSLQSMRKDSMATTTLRQQPLQDMSSKAFKRTLICVSLDCASR